MQRFLYSSSLPAKKRMLILSPLSPNGYEFSSNSNLRNLSLAVISSSEAPPLVIQARSLYITNCGSTYIQPHCPAALMSICSTVFSSLKYAICYYIFVSNCNILIYRLVLQFLQICAEGKLEEVV